MSLIAKRSPQWAGDILLHDISIDGQCRTTANRLQESIKTAIRTGRLAAGTLLPPSRTLAAELDCSRSVVVSAYQQLSLGGYLESRQGSGTFVAETSPAPTAPTPSLPQPRYRYMFSPGVADLSSFPRSEWLDAVSYVMTTVSRDDLHYSSPHGAEELRTVLSERLLRVRGVVVHPDNIHVCSGTVQALCLLAHALTEEGHRTIALEDPTWDQLRPPLESAGLRVAPLDVDHEGVRIDDLWSRPEVKAVLLTPAHQFPTGVVMSASRRGEVLRWAKSRDAIIVEDDYDAEFCYGRRQFALQQDSPNHIVYLGTTSKILSPGLRLGWMVTPPRITKAVHSIRTSYDLGVPALDQLALTHLISTGVLDRHLRKTRPKYNRRRHALITALRSEIEGVEISSAPAGLHLLARFPGPCSEERLVAEAARRSVYVLHLSKFLLGEVHDRRPTLVLGYANTSEDAIVAGVRELRRAWECVR